MAPESRVYRSGATIVPLFFWALLLSGGGLLAVEAATARNATPEAKTVAGSIAVLALLFGPLAFAACLLRLCLSSVTLDPQEGVLLSGRPRIPWKEVVSVERREAALKGLIRANALLLFLTGGCMALLYYVVVPSVVLFTPWHQRVFIRLTDGRTLVLRDLRRVDAFMREVRRHVGTA